MMMTTADHYHQVVKNNEVPAVGYRFDPTDKELVVDYLFHKVHGKPLPSTTAVKECDVYGDSHAWKGLFEAMEEYTLYFFTRLKKKTEKGKRIDRATDSGTWKGQQGDKEIFCYDDNHQMFHVGSRRNFSFIPKEGIQETRCTWVMHEYRLDGCLLDQNNNSYVLCRIKKMKKGKNGRAATNYNDDDEDNGRAAEVW